MVELTQNGIRQHPQSHLYFKIKKIISNEIVKDSICFKLNYPIAPMPRHNNHVKQPLEYSIRVITLDLHTGLYVLLIITSTYYIKY